MGRSAGSGLKAAVERLAAYHGAPPPPPSCDAFELILFENVAYLAPDDRRRRAFHLLRDTVGTRADAILGAPPGALEAATSQGILEGTSAAKLRRCAEILRTSFGGDLRPVLDGPVREAKRALQMFPGIGEPGAEKILLFSAGRPFLAPDSNGLRVLIRFGLAEEQSTYARTYAAARAAAEASEMDLSELQRAHGLLRMHGQKLCTRTRPKCAECPLRDDCPYAAGSGGRPAERGQS